MSTLPEPDPRNPEDSGAPVEADSPIPPPGENLPMEAWPSRSMPAELVCLPNETPADHRTRRRAASFPILGSTSGSTSRAHSELRSSMLFVITGSHWLRLHGGIGPSRHALSPVWLGEISAESATDVRFILASEGILYIFTFGFSLLVFPLFWNESFFAGIQWRGTVALNRYKPLVGVALVCLGLAAIDGTLMPGPPNAPIETILHAPGAAWLMFGFGITIAPFFEEMFFRGFLLPALCTAWDWAANELTANPPSRSTPTAIPSGPSRPWLWHLFSPASLSPWCMLRSKAIPSDHFYSSL